MIPKQTVLKRVKQLFKRTDNCELKLLTFKKDRTVTLLKQGSTITIHEQGYQTRDFENLSPQEAHHLLKKLLAYEFPRSHNVYLSKKDPD
ncbi:hypothetical protein [Lactobacillus selangorensis]|nr:hypothetical protein [Lactobacillus selangorensis]